jgi:hypothetical protein
LLRHCGLDNGAFVEQEIAMTLAFEFGSPIAVHDDQVMFFAKNELGQVVACTITLDALQLGFDPEKRPRGRLWAEEVFRANRPEIERLADAMHVPNELFVTIVGVGDLEPGMAGGSEGEVVPGAPITVPDAPC